MALPTPDEISEKTYYRNYWIGTPAFQLTPIEKPDMSPFLIHMTGKGAILDILEGKNAPNPVVAGHGFLKAGIPEYTGEAFDAKVVCFSESPTFAVDFFRYRKKVRWQADQSYGLGFDKASLAKQGARPVIYVDERIRSHIIYLHRRIRDNGLILSDDREINARLVEAIQAAYPLLYPLSEDSQFQGFMWEREWRHTDAAGLEFSHEDIKIICCPENEEAGIKQLLGATANQIDFVHTWQEYDDVTNYLSRQHATWRNREERIEKFKGPNKEKLKVENLLAQYNQALNSLDAYLGFLESFRKEIEHATQEREDLAQKIAGLSTKLKEIEAKNQPAKVLPAPRKPVARAVVQK